MDIVFSRNPVSLPKAKLLVGYLKNFFVRTSRTSCRRGACEDATDPLSFIFFFLTPRIAPGSFRGAFWRFGALAPRHGLGAQGGAP